MNIRELELLSYDGLKLRGYFHKCHGESNQTIIFTHGISEYAIRHDYLIAELGDRYNLVFHDLRGHGESEGDRGYIKLFQDFEKDLYSWIEYSLNELKLYGELHLMGHSMGGLITLGALESQSVPSKVRKVFLSAPAIGVGDSIGSLVQRYIPSTCIDLLGRLLHKLPLKGRVDTSQLSHETNLKELYENDPVILNGLSARLLTQVLVRGQYLSRTQLNFQKKIKLKILVGTCDNIVSINAIQSFALKYKEFIELIIIQDALHEMHFEADRYKKEYFLELNHFFP